MATFAGLLELEGPRGHTVRDFPPGVLYAARAAVPPSLFLPFVQDLLNWCSPDYNERIDLHRVQFWTSLMHYPEDLPQDVPEALTQQHLVAFRRHIWPRKQSVAELEGYSYYPKCCRLHHLDPRLRQLLDALFAHESECVLTAVLQHLLDTGARNLSGATAVLENVLTGERPSMTIPDDPRVHGLLRQAVDALRSMLAQEVQVGSGSSSHDKAAATDESRSDGGQPPGTRQHGPPLWRGSGRDSASSSGSSSSSSSSAEGVTSEQPPVQDSGTQKPAALPGPADTPEPALSPTAVAACVLRWRRRG